MIYLTTHSTHFIYGYMASDIFSISSKGSFICVIPDRITHTTAFVTPVVEHWLLTNDAKRRRTFTSNLCIIMTFRIKEIYITHTHHTHTKTHTYLVAGKVALDSKDEDAVLFSMATASCVLPSSEEAVDEEPT